MFIILIFAKMLCSESVVSFACFKCHQLCYMHLINATFAVTRLYIDNPLNFDIGLI